MQNFSLSDKRGWDDQIENVLLHKSPIRAANLSLPGPLNTLINEPLNALIAE
jgi:hypothetical protein